MTFKETCDEPMHTWRSLSISFSKLPELELLGPMDVGCSLWLCCSLWYVGECRRPWCSGCDPYCCDLYGAQVGEDGAEDVACRGECEVLDSPDSLDNVCSVLATISAPYFSRSCFSFSPLEYDFCILSTSRSPRVHEIYVPVICVFQPPAAVIPSYTFTTRIQ